MKKIEINPDYKFTFATDDQLVDTQIATGYIESYDIVRICVKRLDNGNQIDYPLKTREDYINEIARLNERASEFELVEIYQDTHMFDMYDYI
jgi:hypothetical protein